MHSSLILMHSPSTLREKTAHSLQQQQAGNCETANCKFKMHRAFLFCVLCIWPLHEQCSLNMRLFPFLILCAVMGACMHTARSGKTTGGQCRICFNICQLFPSATCARCTATQIIMHLACSYAVCVQWLELCMQRSAFLPAPARHRESLNGHACNQAG